MTNRKEMKKFLAICVMMVAVLTIHAIPAKPGLWQTITLPDGNEVRVQMKGNEHQHYFESLDGTPYINKGGVWQKANLDSLREQAQMRLARRKAHRKLTSASTSNGLGKYGQSGTGAVKSIGSLKIPVIMVQFKDLKFKESTTSDKIDRMCNEAGYHDEKNCVGSVRDYFISQSSGMFSPKFLVVSLITLPKSYKEYGKNDEDGNDIGVDSLVIDAVKAAMVDGVNFNNFKDNEGNVQLVSIFYAGKGEATENHDISSNANYIWPCEWDINEDINGIHFNSYFVGNELYTGGTQLMGMGVFCHEFGHALGIPDWYCTNYSYSNDDAFSNWSVMDTGAYVFDGYAPIGYTAYEKSMMGWTDIQTLDDNTEATRLYPGTDAKKLAVRIPVTGSATEYFILENRYTDTWYPESEYYGSFGTGLMLTHINYSAYAWNNNEVNNIQDYKRAHIITADNKALYYSSDNANLFGNGVNDITSLTLTNGRTKIAKIYNIEKYDDGSIGFTNNPNLTAIQAISEKKDQINRKGIYSLNGTYLGNDKSKLKKGVYIIDGKKVTK